MDKNDGMWAVQHDCNDWKVSYAGVFQGIVSGDIPKDKVLDFWLDTYPFIVDEDGEDIINAPRHYTVGGYEALDVIKAKLTREEYIGACKAKILKYIMRSNYKGTHDQDCGKAQYYADELMEAIDHGEEENGNTQLPNPPF